MSNGKRRKLCTNSRKHAYVYCSKAENFDVLLNAPYFHFRLMKGFDADSALHKAGPEYAESTNL